MQTFPCWRLLRACLVVLTALLCSTCLGRSVHTRVIGVRETLEIEPIPYAMDRITRRFVVRLRFDQPIADSLHPDAFWLVKDEQMSGVLSDAARGSLATSRAGLRIPAVLTRTRDDPYVVEISPIEPVLPDTSLRLVSTARLQTLDGAPIRESPEGRVGVWDVAMRVAPPAQCPPIARLEFPLERSAPQTLDWILISFNRPIVMQREWAIALKTESGESVAVRATPGCSNTRGEYGCVSLIVDEVLHANTRYRLEMLGIQDATGLEPQWLNNTFETGDDWSGEDVAFAGPLPCANEETEHDGLCVLCEANALSVRVATRESARVRLRLGDGVAVSDHGTMHTVRIERSSAFRDEALRLELLRADGHVMKEQTVMWVEAEQIPTLKIVEALARPISSSAQEFVELLNDGDQTVSLEGMSLHTTSGTSLLPTTLVSPGARVLLVGESFDPRGGRGDVAVGPNVQLVRVATAQLASRGLSDRGGAIWLSDRRGRKLSCVPELSETLPPRSGVSVVRRDLRMKEDDNASWSYDVLGTNSPGLPEPER